ncbi:MAG TPA: hypothetical protein H9668_06850 [Firmicutes bacterium]|nr:hypothetical protein [Bacillota bacterium]
MRKSLALVLCAVFLFLCTACTWNGEKWKTVEIMEFPMENGTCHEGEVYGTLRIPEDWVFTQDGERLYFTDRPVEEEGCRIYLVSFVENDADNAILQQWNRPGLIGEMHATPTDDGGGCSSNGIMYRSMVWDIADEGKSEKWQIAIPNIPLLVAWDNLVDRDDIRRIAASFAYSAHWREEHR